MLLRNQLKMREPRTGDAVLAPAMNRRERRLGEARHSGCAAQRIDDLIGLTFHSQQSATFADKVQPSFCDNGSCDSRSSRFDGWMTPEEIRAELSTRNMTIRDLAEATGIGENFLSKMLGKQRRRIQIDEMAKIEEVLKPDEEELIGEKLRSVPVLGDVPAGGFLPSMHPGGRRVTVIDTDTPARAYGLRVKGDSMDLIVPDGATVIVDPDDTKLWPGERYIIMTHDGETTFKEFQADPARLVPCSSNSANQEIAIGDEPIKVLGKVIAFVATRLPRRSI